MTTDLDPYSKALFDAVAAAFPTWLTAQTRQILASGRVDLDSATTAEIDAVVVAATHEATDALMRLFTTDVDDQATNPLHVIRSATRRATEYARSRGVSPVARDEWDERALPHDLYAIGPIAWRDLGEDVHDAGISWGAWKAATVLSRRRAEGKIQ